MAPITMNDQLVPMMMSCILKRVLPRELEDYEDHLFIAKCLLISAEYTLAIDPICDIDFVKPPEDHECGPIPKTGCCIVTLIGKWYDLRNWNYSAIQYTISNIHDHNKNDQATFDALQELGEHINDCLTHPVTSEMIVKADGDLSSDVHDISFVLVVGKCESDIYYIDPSDEDQEVQEVEYDSSYISEPSIGWLCMFVSHGRYSGSPVFYLPIADLSRHTAFMASYDPNDLPPRESLSYRALTQKWKIEQSNKQLSSRMPRPRDLNPYIYVELWNAYYYNKHSKKEAQQYFEEYKALFLQQQAMNIVSCIQQQQQLLIKSNNTNDIVPGLDQSNFIALFKTLYEECYSKYITNQLDNLKIISYLKYYQHQQQSFSKLQYYFRRYRYRHNNTQLHFVLSPPTSHIDIMIELAASPDPTSYIMIDELQYQNTTQTKATTTKLPTTPLISESIRAYSSQQQNLSNIESNNIYEQNKILRIQYDELYSLFQHILNEKCNEIDMLNDKVKTLIQQSEIDKLLMIEQHQTNITQLNIQHIREQQKQLQYHDVSQHQQYEQHHYHPRPHSTTQLLNKDKTHDKDNFVGNNNNNNNNNNNITFLKEQITLLNKQLDLKDMHYQKELESKDKQIENKDQQIKELLQSKDKQLETKDKQLEAKDQQIALLMQMLANSTHK